MMCLTIHFFPFLAIHGILRNLFQDQVQQHLLLQVSPTLGILRRMDFKLSKFWKLKSQVPKVGDPCSIGFLPCFFQIQVLSLAQPNNKLTPKYKTRTNQSLFLLLSPTRGGGSKVQFLRGFSLHIQILHFANCSTKKRHLEV